MNELGPHFLCWISEVVSFNMWLISSWEENNCCYKLSMSNKKKWQLTSVSKKTWTNHSGDTVLYGLSFCAFAQLLTKYIFFSAWDESRVKWNNSRNSTQKMRTLVCRCFKNLVSLYLIFFGKFPGSLSTLNAKKNS